MLLTLCLLACAPDNLVRPLPPMAVDVQQPVTNAAGCATVVVGVSGSNGASAAFPADSACRSGLVLIAGGTATYDRPGGGRFTLPVRIVNRSGVPVTVPIRIDLPPDSSVVLSPPGLAKNGKKGVTPVAPDSALRAGAVWLVGVGASLAAGDSTTARDLTFVWDNGVHDVRFGLRLSSEAEGNADTTRPALPDGLAVPSGPLRLAPSPYATEDSVFRNGLGLVFWDSTSGATIRSILARYQLTIIGGSRAPNSNSVYIVQMPDPGAVLDSLLAMQARIEAEPGIRTVELLTHRGYLDPRTRYPVDPNLAATRAAWFGAGTATTRTWLSVRAPLAWGCETGEYNTSPVPVGILDLFFDAVHQDLSSSTVVIQRPNAAAMAWGPDGLNGMEGSHGTRIAGVVAAQGDNGQFLAGVLWRARLQLMAFGHGDSVVEDPVDRVVEMLRVAQEAGLEILNLSTGVDRATDAIAVSRIRIALASYLDSDAKRLVVLATGNDGLTLTLGQLASGTGADELRMTALDRAAAQLAQIPTYRSKILWVTGAQSDHTRWPFANVWVGAAMIAAPSDAFLTLSGTNQVSVDSGTSIAAPFATGLAAALWSADSSLTGAQVQDYILRGAQQPRIDSMGVGAVPPAIGGISGVYLLDAYGSLSLLSHERPGTPLCGVPVTWSGNTLHFGRNADEAVEVPGFAGINYNGVSVAQGGRQISVFGSDSAGDPRSAILDQHGHVIRNLVDSVQRVFLERDTVDLTLLDNGIESIPLVTIKRANGTQTSDVDLYGPNEPGATYIFNTMPPIFSPAGDWVFVSGEYGLQVACTTHTVNDFVTRGDLIRFDGTGAVNVRREPGSDCGSLPETCPSGCDGAESVAAWAPDARHLVFGVERDVYSTAFLRLGQTFTPVDLTGSAPSVGAEELYVSPPDDWLSDGLAYASDGSVLYGVEDNAAFDCRSVVRSAVDPELVLSTGPAPAGTCRQTPIFNSPGILSSRSRPSAGRFSLGARVTQAAWLADKTARAFARVGPGMVMAN